MRYFLLVIIVLLMAAPCFSQPFATFTPGQANGLELMDAPDGRFDSLSFEGRDIVRLRKGTDPESSYLYFRFSPALRDKLPTEVYLVVDFYDQYMGSVRIEYNSPSSAYLLGSGFLTTPAKAWERTLLHITRAQFTGRQNAGADFRLALPGANIALSRIEVYTEKPQITVRSDKDRLMQHINANPKKTDMFYTFGNDADEAQAILFKSLGVTSVESYVTWESVEGAGEGKWDWSKWDKQVAILKDAGLKWVPFLILSPAYSTPNWFRQSKEHIPCRCLEHGTDSKIESLWNPNLPKWVDRFIGEFAKRYKDSGVIESVLLGIQGDFGEAIYSVTGGGWTFDIPGEYHNHPGFWCDDPYALASYRQFITRRYKTIPTLNKAWGGNISSIDKVDFPARGEKFEQFKIAVPTAPAGTKRQWIDFVDWYRESMTNWADWWMGITRKYFPTDPIYLCTGGHAPPEHGSNFAEQCRVAAKHKAGVRITNEASHYPSNFMITRWVASAGKHYGAYFSFEPAGPEDINGIPVRIYNATASGANQLHDYIPNIINSGDTMEAQQKHFQYLFHVEKPIVPVALWYPNVALTVQWGGFLEKAARLRDFVDHDYIDESMLRTGALKHSRILVIAHGSIMEPADAKRIAAWIESGGRVIVMDVPKITSVEGTLEPEKSLFGNTPNGRALGKGSIIRMSGWASLASELTKTLTQLQLSFPEVKEDGVFGTQISVNRFLFLNTNNSEIKIDVRHNGNDVPVTVHPNTITDIKL